jgi:hypothetical protein
LSFNSSGTRLSKSKKMLLRRGFFQGLLNFILFLFFATFVSAPPPRG